MHPSLRICSGKAHQPLIKFIGRRMWPSAPEAAHAHPAAPTELQQRFGEFVKKFQSSSSSASPQASTSASDGTAAVYTEFWEAPSRFWRPRVRELEEVEMDAIMSGGASIH